MTMSEQIECLTPRHLNLQERIAEKKVRYTDKLAKIGRVEELIKRHPDVVEILSLMAEVGF